MDKNQLTKQWQENEALKRFKIISPLLEETLDLAARQQLREKQAEHYQISVRSIYRYENAYRRSGFAGLKPMNREMRRSPSLPENFDELVSEAIQLKREVPSRSISQIILILEMEGRVAPGALKRSTLQRHVYDAGFGKKQMKKIYGGRKKFFQTILQTTSNDAGGRGSKVWSNTSNR